MTVFTRWWEFWRGSRICRLILKWKFTDRKQHSRKECRERQVTYSTHHADTINVSLWYCMGKHTFITWFESPFQNCLNCLWILKYASKAILRNSIFNFHECFDGHTNTKAYIRSLWFQVNRNMAILKLCAKQNTEKSFLLWLKFIISQCCHKPRIWKSRADTCCINVMSFVVTLSSGWQPA